MAAFPLPLELTDRPFVVDPWPVAARPRFDTGWIVSSSEDTEIASAAPSFFPVLCVDVGAFLRLLDGPATSFDVADWEACS